MFGVVNGVGMVLDLRLNLVRWVGRGYHPILGSHLVGVFQVHLRMVVGVRSCCGTW